jgi:hypothetical protein
LNATIEFPLKEKLIDKINGIIMKSLNSLKNKSFLMIVTNKDGFTHGMSFPATFGQTTKGTASGANFSRRLKTAVSPALLTKKRQKWYHEAQFEENCIPRLLQKDCKILQRPFGGHSMRVGSSGGYFWTKYGGNIASCSFITCAHRTFERLSCGFFHSRRHLPQKHLK